jgi:hypothetical protein
LIWVAVTPGAADEVLPLVVAVDAAVVEVVVVDELLLDEHPAMTMAVSASAAAGTAQFPR